MFGPILRGERVRLEPPSSEDLPTYRAWFSNPEVTRTLLARFAPSEKAEEEWFERAGASEDQLYWRIVANEKTIGNTGIHRIDWINRGGRTGLVIGDTTAWGKGYASEAVKLRTEYAFNELGLERLGSESFVENIPMHRALEKSGYQKIGRERKAIFRSGCWHDLYLFEVLREEWLTRQT
jgi:RimJ/RimL family protein N-acetyltransferase